MNKQTIEQTIVDLLQSNSVPSEQGGRVVEESDFTNVAQQIAAPLVESNQMVKANELIRSFSSVVERRGANTDWEALGVLVKSILQEQHRQKNISIIANEILSTKNVYSYRKIGEEFYFVKDGARVGYAGDREADAERDVNILNNIDNLSFSCSATCIVLYLGGYQVGEIKWDSQYVREAICNKIMEEKKCNLVIT